MRFKTFITEAQEISSADTSLKQVASTFKQKKFWMPGTRNLDIGGGRYDLGTEHLMSAHKVQNFVYDPFNRSKAHNEAVMAEILKMPPDTVTVNNVLNVIKEPETRAEVIHQAAMYMKSDGVAYFLVYEGNRSGTGKISKVKEGVPSCWQNNQKTAFYVPEVKKYFNDVRTSGNIIIAKDPKKR